MQRSAILTVLAIGLLLAAPVKAGPIAAGDRLPPIRLLAPDSPQGRSYLGLDTTATDFVLNDIQAPVVIVEIFSMYCPHCQREAPAVNRLHRLIEETPKWRDAVRLIGVGIGNSAYEVNFFKESYKIEFPLIPDADFAIHNALGKPRTPYFLAIRIDDHHQAHLVYTLSGAFSDPAAFLEAVVTRAGIR